MTSRNVRVAARVLRCLVLPALIAAIAGCVVLALLLAASPLPLAVSLSLDLAAVVAVLWALRGRWAL